MLRVLTFNILTGRDLTGRFDLGRTADVIAAAEPDLVGLQEVDRHYSERSDFLDQSAWLAERLGWHGGFAPGMIDDPAPGRDEPREYGVALLTPHPMAEFTAHRLTNLPTDDPRIEIRAAAEARVVIDGRTVHMINTHLEVRDAAQREHQAQQVSALLDAAEGPAVVTGDFNAEPENPAVQAISRTAPDVAAATAGAALTFPSDTPTIRIDYVFARDLVPIRSAVLDTRASDHRPVLAELDWM